MFFLPGGRAIKLFKRQIPPDDEHVRAVFESEIGAYKIAASIQELSTVVPKYFGCVNVSDVLDEQNISVREQFLLGFAYEIDYVCGDFVKLGTLQTSTRLELINRFRRHGIGHITDASVVLTADGGVVSIIDFAIEEHEQFHPAL